MAQQTWTGTYPSIIDADHINELQDAITQWQAAYGLTQSTC